MPGIVSYPFTHRSRSTPDGPDARRFVLVRAKSVLGSQLGKWSAILFRLAPNVIGCGWAKNVGCTDGSRKAPAPICKIQALRITNVWLLATPLLSSDWLQVQSATASLIWSVHAKLGNWPTQEAAAMDSTSLAILLPGQCHLRDTSRHFSVAVPKVSPLLRPSNE